MVFAIRTSSFQTWAAQKMAKKLSEDLNTTVRIDKVDIRFINKVLLEGVYIEDLHGDTLVWAPTIKGKVYDYSFKKQFFDIEDLNLIDANIELKKYEGEEDLNFQFLADYFDSGKEKDTSKSPWDVNVRAINLTKVDFSYSDFNKEPIEKGIDFNHIDLENTYITLNDFKQIDDTTFIGISNLKAIDKSGFVVENLSSNLEISEKGLYLHNLDLKTGNSHLKTDLLSFKTKSLDDFNDFENKVKMKANFKEGSYLQMADIAYFTPEELWGINSLLQLEGTVRGTVNKLKTKDLAITYDNNTKLKLNVSLKNITDIDNAFMAFDIQEFKSNTKDIAKIELPPFNGTKFLSEDLPPNFWKLGDIEFSGSFLGYANDFVAFGDIKSDVGDIKTDIQFRVDTLDNQFHYSGNVVANDFKLGYMYDIPDMGNISANIVLEEATGLDIDHIKATVTGDVNALDFNDYTYTNIKLDHSTFDKSSFEGDLTMNDPNIYLKYDGTIDFHDMDMPKFDFTAEVNNANLGKLNFSDRDPNAAICMTIHADAKGSNLDNFRGIIDVNEVDYYENGENYEFGNTKILAIDSTTGLYLGVVNEDIFRAEITGDFKFATFGNSFTYMASTILPALVSESNVDYFAIEDYFDFYFSTYNTSQVTKLLIPELFLGDSIFIEGHVNAPYDELSYKGLIPYLQYDSTKLENIVLDGEKNDDIGFNIVKANEVYLSEDLDFKNIELDIVPYQDNVDFKIQWFNDTTSYGTIRFDALFHSFEKIDISAKKSDFAALNHHWEINKKALIQLDTTSIHIDSLNLRSDDQFIDIEGVVSEIKEDELTLLMSNFNVENINPLIGNHDLLLSGILDGDASLSNLYGTPSFVSDIAVNQFGVNNHEIGQLLFSNVWDNKNGDIVVNGELNHEEIQVIDFSGSYHTKREKDNLDLHIKFDNKDLTFLNSFLPQEEIGGFAAYLNGEVTIKGEPDHIVLEGDLNLSEGEVHIGYLNVNYYFDGDIVISEDGFEIPMLYMKDEDAYILDMEPQGYLNGNIAHKNFEDIDYEFTYLFNQMMMMNTTYEMNTDFYGDVYASGFVVVNGEGEKVHIDVQESRSEKGTKFFLPLYGADEVEMQDFVNFVSHDSSLNKEYSIDLEDITMDFELDVTEDAEIQILFDPSIGDVMTGRVDGHLSMEVTDLGDFKMFGDVIVKEGNYLFTMYNVINKEFDVEPGGTISWTTGDPEEAQVNLNAIYKVNAPLYDLMNSDEKYKDNMDIDCYMNMQGSLYNPEILFDIQVPKADGEVLTALNRVKQDEQELNKQMFSLMIINKFMPIAGGGDNIVGGALSSTSAELLNSQLSNWLSQISDDFDLGFNYKPGDEISNEEIALAFSTQLLNDRLLLSGNFGVSNAAQGSQNPNSFIGDFSVEYIITKDSTGSFRVRAYNESNEFDLTNTSQAKYTQGAGVSYTEEFEKLTDLKFFRFFKKLFTRKKNKEATKPEETEVVEGN